MFTPPDHFAIVQDGVYRSMALHPNSFSYISTLHLRTILNLSPDPPTRAVQAFAEDHRIQLLSIQPPAHTMAKTFDSATWTFTTTNNYTLPAHHRPLDERLKLALETILNRDHHPLLIYCSTGIHDTGTVVGCLRKFQGWNFTSILSEYEMFGGTKSRLVNEQMIEFFDLDLVAVPITGRSLIME